MLSEYFVLLRPITYYTTSKSCCMIGEMKLLTSMKCFRLAVVHSKEQLSERRIIKGRTLHDVRQKGLRLDLAKFGAAAGNAFTGGVTTGTHNKGNVRGV